MEKGNSQDRKTCKRIIIAMNAGRPMNDQDRRIDSIYGIALCILWIFVPLISIPWLMTLNKPLTALIVNVSSFAISLLIGLSRRKWILNSFYLVKDAYQLFDMRNGNEKIDELCTTNETLLCLMPLKDVYLDLLYNWFCWRKLLETGEKLPCYEVDGRKLSPYLNDENKLDQQVLLMTFKGRLPDSASRFYNEKDLLGVYLLNDVKKKKRS